MSEEQIQQQDTQETPATPMSSDTPDNAFSDSTDSSNEGFSFDDVIFGPEGERQPAQAPPRTPQQVAEDTTAMEQPGQPAIQAPQGAQDEYQAKNDDKRFEYWQSQASKLENRIQELETQKPLQQYAQQNPQAYQQAAEPRYTTQGPQQPVQQQPVEEEGFPPPPERPSKPRNFNREAAYTDSASESAGYMDDMEDWRDRMDDYNQLKGEYESTRVEEYLQQQQAERQQMLRQNEAAQHHQKQLGEINEYVQANYGLDANQAVEFINEYSDPKSISMDNLVQLYRFQHGVVNNTGNEVQPAQNAPVMMDSRPSPTFQQTQRAQQIPAPMGVSSGQGSSNPDDGKPMGQNFMEALIGNHNKNDAF